MDFLYQIGGVTRVQDNLKIRFQNQTGGVEFTPAALRVTDKLTLDRCIFGEDWSKSDEAAWKLLQSNTELKSDSDLGRGNRGITIVLL